jgi:hypothetical protein
MEHRTAFECEDAVGERQHEMCSTMAIERCWRSWSNTL